MTFNELNLIYPSISKQREIPNKQIYFREHLSNFQIQLYREAKAIKVNHYFKHLWIKNNIIHMRKTDDSKVYVVHSRNDIISIENLQERHYDQINDSSLLSSY